MNDVLNYQLISLGINIFKLCCLQQRSDYSDMLGELPQLFSRPKYMKITPV